MLSMILADAAFDNTVVTIIVFGVAFPALVTALIAMAVVQALGERADNQSHAGRWGRDTTPELERD